MPQPFVQKSTSTATLVSTKSIKPGGHVHPPRGPIDMHYMRRVAVRLQKQSVILQQLNALSVYHFYTPAIVFFLTVLIIFALQIVIVVKKTILWYVFGGFWVPLPLTFCIVALFIFGKSLFCSNTILLLTLAYLLVI